MGLQSQTPLETTPIRTERAVPVVPTTAWRSLSPEWLRARRLRRTSDIVFTTTLVCAAAWVFLSSLPLSWGLGIVFGLVVPLACAIHAATVEQDISQDWITRRKKLFRSGEIRYGSIRYRHRSGFSARDSGALIITDTGAIFVGLRSECRIPGIDRMTGVSGTCLRHEWYSSDNSLRVRLDMDTVATEFSHPGAVEASIDSFPLPSLQGVTHHDSAGYWIRSLVSKVLLGVQLVYVSCLDTRFVVAGYSRATYLAIACLELAVLFVWFRARPFIPRSVSKSGRND